MKPKIMEALNIRMTPSQQRLNRDERLELAGCWMATIRMHVSSQSGAYALSGVIFTPTHVQFTSLSHEDD